MRKAVILLSGGLDSTTTLFLAKSKGYKCLCLIFDYGQRHKKEINRARRIARYAGCKYKIVKFSLPWKGSSLLDKTKSIPKIGSLKNIPSTYVPARNIIFLSFAVSIAESENIDTIFIGANQIDFSGYPDCRESFYKAMQRVIKVGTKSGAQNRLIKIKTPLIHKTKAQIIKLALKLNVPLRMTWSCYQGKKHPCGKCDSCRLRLKGFKEVGLKDPLHG